MAKKIPAIPIHRILNSAAVESLGSQIAFAMLVRLMLYSWAAGCEALPTSDNFFSVTVRANDRTWKRWKPVILAAWRDIEPELRRARAQRDRNYRRIRAIAQKGADVQHARAVVKRLAARGQAPAPAPHVAKRAQDVAPAAGVKDDFFVER